MVGCGYHRSHTRHWFFVDHGFIIVFFILPLLPFLCSRMIFLCFSFTTIFGNLFHPSIFKSFDNIWYMAEWLLCISLVYSLFFSSFVLFQLLSGPLHVWCLWSHIGNTYHFPFSTSIHFSPVPCDFYGPPFWFCFQLQLVLMARRYKQIHFLNTLGLLNLIWMLTKKKKKIGKIIDSLNGGL